MVKYLVLRLMLLIVCIPWGFVKAQNNYRKISGHDTIIAVVLKDMRPNSFFNPKSKKLEGFNVDITNAICKLANYHIKYKIVNDWKEAEMALLYGEADFCPLMAKTEYRTMHFLFSEPVQTFNISICVRDKNRDIKDTASLKGKTVGVIKASKAFEILNKIRNINLVEFKSFQEAVFELLAGHIDAYVGPEQTIRNIALEASIYSEIKIIPEPIIEEKRYFVFSRKDTPTYLELKPIIHSFASSDRYKEIYTHWNLPPQSYWTVKHILVLGGIGFIAIIIISLLLHNRAVVKINNQLKKTIIEKEKAHNRLKEVFEEIQNMNAQLEEAKNKVEENEVKFKEAIVDLNNAQVYSKIGSWKWHIPENILEWSDEMYHIFEIEKNTFTGYLPDVMFQRIHPDDLKKVEESNLSVIEKGIPIPVEYRLCLPDGTIKTVWGEAGELKRDEKGNPSVLEGIVQDITERKKAEIALENEKEKFLKIFERAPVSISISDLKEGVYIDVNNAALQFSGFTKDEVLGHNSIEMGWITKEDREILLSALKEKGKIENIEIPFTTKNGKRVFGLVNGDIIYLNNRKCLLTITSDVTERRLHEESIRKLSSAIDCSKASIVITDFDGRIEYANPYFIEHTGYTPDEFIGNTPRVLKSDFHSKEFYQALWDTIKSGNKWEGEFYNRKKNGDYYWENAIISPVFDNNRNITNFVAVKFDITENKRITHELISAKEKAEESDRFKTAFLHNLSHEIRTPLNAILGFSEVIVKYYNDKDKIEYFTNIIIQRGNDLLEMIDDILNVARIESGNTKVMEQSCYLNTIFLELELLFNEHRTRFQKDNITFEVNNYCKTEKLSIKTDPGKLKQILVNLINNAFKYTDSGKIEVGYTIEDSEIIFYVSDTGIGIPKDKHELIFERFVQLATDKSKVNSGTGLGLSIAKGLTEILGGKIWLDSEPNKGSTFFFSIPYKTTKIKKIPEKKLNPDAYSVLKGNVLIVEDDELNLLYLKEILEETDFKIISTKYGYEAIELAIKKDFDIILMDIGLPDMSGFDTISTIKATKPGIKIIAQTAYASQSDKDKALKAGCIDYISKPIRGELLLQKIKGALIVNNP